MERLVIDLMPAAGWCKTVEQVRMLAAVPVISHIVMGSFTLAPREGNTGGTNFFVREDGTSFNSLGLPNGGIPYLEAHLREMVDITHNVGKLAVVNIAGDTPEEYIRLAFMAFHRGADIVEFNFGCPNKFGKDGAQKEIASYNIELMRKTMNSFALKTLQTGPLWLKFSPYVNPEERVRVASFVNEMHVFGRVEVKRITTSNTFPNCVPRDERGNLLITAKNTNGRGGMAGTALRDIGLANVEHFRELLPSEIQINGVGGISEGKHLAAYHRLGCAGAQIGTAFFNGENFRIFEELATGFLEALEVA